MVNLNIIIVLLQGEDDNSSWYSSAITAPSEAPKDVQTEVDVIRDWFVNIFTPVEKTADLEVTDFKFEQISHLRNSISRHSINANGHSDKVNGNKDPCRSFLSSRLPFHKKSQQLNGGNNRSIVDSETDTASTLPNSPSYPFPEAPFTVLKKADVELKVGGKPKTYSVVIKVSNINFMNLSTARKAKGQND